MLNVIVKGNRHAAVVAASNRAIPLVFVREVDMTGYVNTVGRVGNQHENKVVGWFCDPGDAPFPDGTLLVFAHMGGRMDGFSESRKTV